MVNKVYVLLFTCITILFASCSGGTQEPPSHAEVDSIVNARVNTLQVQMQSKNDSIINDMAKKRADSILTTMKGQNNPAVPQTVK